MSKKHRRRLYRLAGSYGVLATVSPTEISWTLPRRKLKTLHPAARARVNVQFFPGGPWDLAAEPFDIHRYVREIFVEGVPVHQSEQYRDMVARVADPKLKGSVWDCRSVADVDRYFERLCATFDDMRRHGYRSHQALGASPDDEVKVRVGRNGALIKASGGNHRVSFAKILDLDRISVLVCGVHEHYLRRFPRHGFRRGVGTVEEALESAGIHQFRRADVERVARRLQFGDALYAATERPRQKRSADRNMSGAWAIVSLCDDAFLYVAHPSYGLLPLIGL